MRFSLWFAMKSSSVRELKAKPSTFAVPPPGAAMIPRTAKVDGLKITIVPAVVPQKRNPLPKVSARHVPPPGGGNERTTLNGAVALMTWI